MTTIVNSPPTSDGSGVNTIIGLFALIVFGMIFYFFGIPAIRQMGQVGSPQINIPNKIDVNVKQTQ